VPGFAAASHGSRFPIHVVGLGAATATASATAAALEPMDARDSATMLTPEAARITTPTRETGDAKMLLCCCTSLSMTLMVSKDRFSSFSSRTMMKTRATTKSSSSNRRATQSRTGAIARSF
jgi:hypothetical protein